MTTGVDNKSFVVAWADAYTKRTGVPAVASRLDMSKKQVMAKANYLRKIGVQLPLMPRGATTYTVEDLNSILDSKICE